MRPPNDPSFLGDLRLALRSWARFPWLPAASALLGTASLLSEDLVALSIGPMVMAAGWVGTERMVYLRAFRNLPLEVSELGALMAAFILRYALLALIVAFAFFPFLMISVATGPGNGGLVPIFIGSVIIDCLLTFVTPALAFSTRRVSAAIGIGARMIRSEWPRSAGYVLVPPLAILVVAQLLARESDMSLGVEVAVSCLCTLLTLWFKGATAAFYLRRHEVGNDGAAFEDATAEPSVPR